MIICLVVLAILLLVIALIVRGQKEIIFQMLYVLIDDAERLYGSKTGKLKFSYVLEKVYAMIPSAIKLFITYEMLEMWIEVALEEMEEYWEEYAENEKEEPIKVRGFINN